MTQKNTNKKLISDSIELIAFLKEYNSDYVTPAGIAFLDGLRVAGKEPEFVSKQDYDKVVADLYESEKRFTDYSKSVSKKKNRYFF